jgi:hypothetical protein
MQKVKLENLDGKTRDERETYLPLVQFEEKKKGAGTR